MKKRIIKIIDWIFLLLNFIYSNITHYKYIVFRNKLYSYWIKFNFKECSNPSFSKPVYLQGGKYIIIGKNFHSHPRLRIEAIDSYRNKVYQPKIKIGNNVSFNFNCHVAAINKILIKDNVLIGSNVLITDHSHGDTSKENLNTIVVERPLYSKGPVIIEENVWIGENVSVLPGVTIGKNSIIGANTVVSKNVPPDVIVVGNPMRVLMR
ncbi:acyltransferase [Solitalea longa]|uniref:Acyltransferase n=1 Tax=Solitalea longa TaxID=2079460 RepID=A0A2S4ZX68_9SPHI|nr:acyltransferase [Solitalea longa]POY34905.1 acyltransferase [Solitalea longa]